MPNAIRDFFYSSIVKRAGEREAGHVLNHAILRRGPVDWIFIVLGWFTHIYGTLLTVLFFLHADMAWPIVVGLLQALQEPYLGALGVYVVLKEVRKRAHKEKSLHKGEFFVGMWLLLLLTSTLSVIFISRYHFDLVYKMIITNSLATLIIYLGGVINRS